MILYFDSSAIVPLTIAEPSSGRCGELWDGATIKASSRLAYAEVAAALASAARGSRISEETHQLAMGVLEELWIDMTVVEVDDSLVRGAADIARDAGLTGYDAMHAVSAMRLSSDEVIGVSRNRELLAAWDQFGVPAINTNVDSE